MALQARCMLPELVEWLARPSGGRAAIDVCNLSKLPYPFVVATSRKGRVMEVRLVLAVALIIGLGAAVMTAMAAFL
jgi:hypothetical protein